MDDPVQGSEPQGGEPTGTPTALESYLQTVPEDVREHVQPYLKDAEKNVNSRLAEAAEIKRALGQYQQVDGLTQYAPEQLSELLAWHQQVSSSPDAYQSWLAEAAKEAGLTPAEEQQVDALEADGELTPEKIEQLIDQRADQRVAPLQQSLQELKTERAIDTETENIRSELNRLESEHKLSLSDAQKDILLKLGEDYEGDGSWVQAGFDRYREIVAEGQKAFVADKTGQQLPPSLQGGGGMPAAPATKTFKEAAEQARERFAQSRT